MTDQIPREMNKTPPAIRINWSPPPKVSASAPPIVAPIAVAAVRPRTAPGRTLAQGWRVARLIVTNWVLSPISSRATTPKAVAKTRRLSTDGRERPRGYDALDARFLGRRDLSNVFQIHERIVEFRHVPQHADGPRPADPDGHIDTQHVLRESSVSIWASEPEPLSVNPHLHILDQRLHPRGRLDRSLEGGRVLPRERHADVLMENGTQLDPGLESGAVSIGSGEVTTCGISRHDLPQGEAGWGIHGRHPADGEQGGCEPSHRPSDCHGHEHREEPHHRPDGRCHRGRERIVRHVERDGPRVRSWQDGVRPPHVADGQGRRRAVPLRAGGHAARSRRARPRLCKEGDGRREARTGPAEIEPISLECPAAIRHLRRLKSRRRYSRPCGPP